MVICAILGCSNRSGRDKVSFFRIPKARVTGCQRVRDLSKARLTGYLAAISRDDLDSEQKIEDARICSRHYISGAPADLMDELNPDWLPSQCLGHRKSNPNEAVWSEQCYARKRAREQRSSMPACAPEERQKRWKVNM